MAISLHTEGTWVAANATTQTVTLPTHSTGDMLIVRAGMKHATLPGDITVDTAGWTQIDEHNNGTTASSNGGGDVEIAAFYRIAESAAETDPVVRFHASVAATPSCAVATAFSKGGGEVWITPAGDSGSIAAATSYSATMGSHISATAADWLVGYAVTNDNTTLTVPTIAQTGLTLAAVVESPAAALSSATSNDIAADGCYRSVTSGTSSAAAVFSGTNSVADVGAAMVVRLRAATAAPQTVTPTTATLTITPNAPTVTVPNNQLVTPATATLTATRFAPTVQLPQLVTVPATSLRVATYERLLPDAIVSASGFAGAVVAEMQTEDGDTADATSTSAAIRLSFPTPATTPTTGGASRMEALIKGGASDTTAAVEYHQSGSFVIGSGSVLVPATTSAWVGVNIPNASLTDLPGGQARISLNVTGAGIDIARWEVDAGFAPVIGFAVVPPVRTLSLATFEPTVTVEAGGVTVTPDPATLTTAPFAPTVQLPVLVTPATAALAATRFAPTVATPTVVTVPAASLTATRFAPTVATPTTVTPGSAALQLGELAPTVTATNHQRVTPPTAALQLGELAPTVVTPQTVTVPAASLVTAGFAPGVYAGVTVVTQPASLATVGFAPTVTATQNQRVVPITAALALAGFAPTVDTAGPVEVIPLTAALVLAGLAPTVTVAGELFGGLIVRPAAPAGQVAVAGGSGGAMAPAGAIGGTITVDPPG